MKNMYETLERAGEFEKLLELVHRAGLTERLKSEGAVTLFAPNDEACARLDVDKVTQSAAALLSLVEYHFVDGARSADDISGQETLLTHSGKSLTPRTEHGIRLIDNAKYITSDIICSNGIIHVIDNVFLPKVSGWYCNCC